MMLDNIWLFDNRNNAGQKKFIVWKNICFLFDFFNNHITLLVQGVFVEG